MSDKYKTVDGDEECFIPFTRIEMLKVELLRKL